MTRTTRVTHVGHARDRGGRDLVAPGGGRVADALVGDRAAGSIAAHVGDRRDHLRVAAGGLDHRGIDRECLPGAVAGAAVTPGAHGHRHLVGGAACLARAAERVVGEHPHGLVVVQRVARVELDLPPGVAECGQRVGRHLEPKHVPPRPRVWRILRPITRPPPRDHLLDLAQRPAPRRGDPSGTGVLPSDAGELADRRPGKHARRQRIAKRRQPHQRLGHTQSLAAMARPVAEEVLQVLQKRAIAERLMHPHPLALHQPARLLGVMLAAAGGQARQLAVHSLPPHPIHVRSHSTGFSAPPSRTRRHEHRRRHRRKTLATRTSTSASLRHPHDNPRASPPRDTRALPKPVKNRMSAVLDPRTRGDQLRGPRRRVQLGDGGVAPDNRRGSCGCRGGRDEDPLAQRSGTVWPSGMCRSSRGLPCRLTSAEQSSATSVRREG